MRLFVEKGVAATSIRDVARAARVAEGALYRHYASKDALVRELFSTHYLGFGAALAALEADAKDVRAKLDAMIGEFCRFFDANRTLFCFLLFVQHGQLTRIPHDAVTPFDVMRRAVAAGIRGGEVRKRIDPEVATAMVIGLVLQTATSIVYGRIKGALSLHLPDLSAAAWAVLTAS